jgi:hypothetical protein
MATTETSARREVKRDVFRASIVTVMKRIIKVFIMTDKGAGLAKSLDMKRASMTAIIMANSVAKLTVVKMTRIAMMIRLTKKDMMIVILDVVILAIQVEMAKITQVMKK